jgi:nicotinate phosphoribosyltransferase
MIIKSILDSDLYKFTQQMAVIKLYPRAKVRYTFINRDNTEFPEGFANRLIYELKLMENLTLSKDEKDFLKEKCYFLEPTYLDYLQGYKYDSSEVKVIQKEGVLNITIEGYWYKTILWEVPLMAIISELFFEMTNQKIKNKKDREENNLNKAELFRLNNVQYADFGTRRRYSYKIQDELINILKIYPNSSENFVGTSNVHFAYKYDLKPIGTHAHEWFSAAASMYGYKSANFMAMNNWVKVYRGDLGIALTDTFTTDLFLKSFDKQFAKLFDGVRMDSGNYIEFTEKIINHYKKLNIDPQSKTIVFSDSLNPKLVVEIKEYCKEKIKCSFGIGTNFTNDVGVKPLNMVIKLINYKIDDSHEWQNCIKLSDSKNKYTGDKKEIEICKQIINNGR